MSVPPGSLPKGHGMDIGDAEFSFSIADFIDIAHMLRSDTGISLDQSKMSMVYARLAKRLRILGFGDFRKYRKFMATSQGANERQRMARALTTNTTSFFREAHHFDHMKQLVFPQMIAEARRGARIRLWSAGCSSGEEPYSIALTLLSMMSDAAEFDIKILATDIDTDILHKAKEGIYSKNALAPVDAELRQRWLLPAGLIDGEAHWRVHPDLQRLVAFKTANLVGRWPMKGPFQAIFCRNTVIYFDVEDRKLIWTKMASLLCPDGHLYIGHSERIPVENEAFAPDGITVYRCHGQTESSAFELNDGIEEGI